MHLFRHSLLMACALGALLTASAAQAGSNIAACWALSNEFNKCVREYQYPSRGYGHGGGDGDGGWQQGGYGGRGGGYGRGYGGGYRGGYGGGYGGGWDGDQWQGRQRRPRGGDAAAACQAWLIQMKAAGCF